MKNKLLDEEILNALVKKIVYLMDGDIDPKNVEKQLDEFDEFTTREIVYRILNISLNPKNFSTKSIRSFLEDIFEKPMVHISGFYKQLSDKFNGKYSPEELELICECEKQLVCSLLENNDIVETKSCLYYKRYKDGDPIGVSVAPHADIVDTIKRLSTISKLQKTSVATEI